MKNEQWWLDYLENIKASLQNQQFAVSINNCIESTYLTTSIKKECILGALKRILTGYTGVITGQHITDLDQSNFLDCIDKGATSRGDGFTTGSGRPLSPPPSPPPNITFVTVALILLFL